MIRAILFAVYLVCPFLCCGANDSKTDSVGEIDLVLKLRGIYAQNKAHF